MRSDTIEKLYLFALLPVVAIVGTIVWTWFLEQQ